MREKSLQENYQLLKERLIISEQEYSRKNKLFKRGSLSRSVLDTEKQNVIQLRLEKVNLEKDIAVLPSSVAMAQAQLKSAEANIQLQQRNINRTKFYMPFTGRVNSVVAEEGQFIAAGKVLYLADNINKVEISVQLPLNRMREFLSWATKSASASTPLILGSNNTEINAQRVEELIDTLGLNARVHLELSGDLYWKAKVVSVGESVNISTQTISVLVEVTEPYKNIQPGIKPPLLKGMQVSVELAAKPQPAILIPRHALHEQGLYQIVDDRLKIMPLQPQLIMNNWLLFSQEQLADSSAIITSDIVSAIPGQKVRGVHEKALQDKIREMVALSTDSGVK